MQKSYFYSLLALFIFLAPLPGTGIASAEKRPLWEIGLGAAPITMPSYRGSKNQAFYPIPMPYIDYRGSFLRIDRDGLRGLLYDSERIGLDFSGDGAIPAATDEEGPRQGMPDLDPVVEFGPSINIIVHQTNDAMLRIRLPIRAALTSDFRTIDHAGWKTHPHLGLDIKEMVHGWNAGASIGLLFADRDYHGFYYDVPDRYATAFRERYKAGGGYSGISLMLTASRRFKNIWTGLFLRYDNLSGAAFTDSPLLETRHVFMGGFGAAYIFRSSAIMVPSTRDDPY